LVTMPLHGDRDRQMCLGIGIRYRIDIRTGTAIEEGINLPWSRVEKEVAIQIYSDGLIRRVGDGIARLALNLLAVKLLRFEDSVASPGELDVRVWIVGQRHGYHLGGYARPRMSRRDRLCACRKSQEA